MLAFIGSEDLKLLKCLGKSEPPELAGFTAGSPAVRSLVELKASVESRDAKGWSLLFYACARRAPARTAAFVRSADARAAELALGRDGSLGDTNTLKLQRLLYHPHPLVQLLSATILEHVPLVCARWKQIISDRNLAKLALQHSGLALEFLGSEFQGDREIVFAAESGDLLRQLLCLCPDQRMTALSAKQHPFVAGHPELHSTADARGQCAAAGELSTPGWLCNKFQADLETRALDGLTPADILKRQGPLGPVEAGRTAKAGRRRWATLSVEDGPL
ncbi:Cyclin-dependent kinase 3 [Durusdinium trenchii]|uniref:Cyclin-dependent kinase 3 n=1 Tax=Durusdinium trenchii TaxID=1381693 RepID=A0ABP0RJ44_9DINO